jgi:hypothetical protein
MVLSQAEAGWQQQVRSRAWAVLHVLRLPQSACPGMEDLSLGAELLCAGPVKGPESLEPVLHGSLGGGGCGKLGRTAFGRASV